jgi:hypothetical protein
MWNSKTKQRYYWSAIGEDLDRMIKELLDLEQEEEVDIYRLKMHLDSKQDLEVFSEKNRWQLERLMGSLIRDTHRHKRTIGRITKLLIGYRQREQASG